MTATTVHTMKARVGWSKSDLAAEFNMDKRKVGELLAGVQGTGDLAKGGHPTYRIADVALILGAYKSGIDLEAVGADGSDIDPDKLKPKEAKDYWDAQRSKTTYMQDIGELLPKEVLRSALSSIFKRVNTFFVTFPDTLEREMELTPEQAAKAKKLTTQLSRDLHNLVTEAE